MRALSTDPHHLAEQYRNEDNLRARMETHERFGVGPGLEPAVRRELALAGDEALLDIGTGPGGWPSSLRRDGHRGRLVGIDLSPGMIAQARAERLDVQFLVADAQSLPFADSSFDVVTARHMLYHVPDIPLALREARRVLGAGACFFAVTNSADYMREYLEALAEAAAALTGALASELNALLATPASGSFTDLNGPDLIRDEFGDVRMATIDSALRFVDVEPVVRYFNSSMTMTRLDRRAWEAVVDRVRKAVAKRVARGPWIVSKRVVLLSAVRISP